MSYTGKLFGEILYEVRVDNTPYYEEADIEAMLGLHYGNVSSVLIYVERVFHDDKHAHNVLDIFCIDDAGKDHVSFNNKYEYGVNLHFITSDATPIEIAYAHQIDYAVQKHFTHDSQLTILTKDQIDKKFDFDLQAKIVQSAKDYVTQNKNDLDKIIGSDTPGRVGILIRSHLSGIDFTPFDNPSELIKKIEDKVKKEHTYMQEPPKGERLYDAWLNITDRDQSLSIAFHRYMNSKNLEAIAYGTDPDNDIRSMFGYWAMEQKASDYPNIEDAYTEFLEYKQQHNYFEQRKDNIVKRACKELGITQKELAERLDVQPTAVSNWANGQIPKMAQVALEQMLELKDCKDKLQKIKEARDIMASI